MNLKEMRDTNTLISGDQEIDSSEYEDSFLHWENDITGPLTSVSLEDIRERCKRNINDVTIPFINGVTLRNITDWRDALNGFKIQLLNNENDEKALESHKLEERKEYVDENNIYQTVISNAQKNTETVTVENIKKLPLEHQKITVNHKGILQQLQFPIRKLTTYGKYNTLNGQGKKTNLIKVFAELPEFPKKSSSTSQLNSMEFSSKLNCIEFTIIRNTTGRTECPEREKSTLYDGLSRVGTYEDFLRNIPVLHIFFDSNTVRNIEDVDSYENFVEGLVQKPTFKLFGLDCSLLVSSNLV